MVHQTRAPDATHFSGIERGTRFKTAHPLTAPGGNLSQLALVLVPGGVKKFGEEHQVFRLYIRTQREADLQVKEGEGGVIALCEGRQGSRQDHHEEWLRR